MTTPPAGDRSLDERVIVTTHIWTGVAYMRFAYEDEQEMFAFMEKQLGYKPAEAELESHEVETPPWEIES